MDKLSLKIRTEIENLNTVVNILLEEKDKCSLSKLELAGIATYIHNFYNGIENILKQILKSKGIIISESSFWHKELLNTSVTEKIISIELSEQLYDYLSFRHFFVHSYSFVLQREKLDELHKKIFSVYELFLNEIGIVRQL